MRFVSVFCILSLLVLGLASAALAKDVKTTEPNWHWNAFGRAIVPEQEPNDTCPGQALNSGDTVDPACICNPPGGRDYDWYTFTANAGDAITIATFSATDCSYGAEVYDTYLELYASDCATLLTYDDDSGPGFYSLINAYSAPYTGVYNLRVRAYSGSEQGCYTMNLTVGQLATGACCLSGGVCQILNQIDCGNAGGTYQGDNTVCNPNPCPQPPANDVCSGAIVLERCTAGSLTGDTTPYTNNYDPGAGGCTNGYPEAGNDATYVVDLNAGDIVDMTYTQINLDGAFYIVTDCSNVPGTCVAGADATVTGQPETIHYVAGATGTYFIILDSYTTGGGPWTWDYTFTCPAPQACCFSDGHCEMQLPDVCRQMGGTPQGTGSTCDSVQCQVNATKSTTWGQIKGSYR